MRSARSISPMEHTQRTETQSERRALEDFHTPDAIAKRLGVSRSMIYALIRRGELHATYIGRLPRIAESELTAYLARAGKRGD